MAEEEQPYLSDLSERDKPWDGHRANAVTVESHYAESVEPEFQRYAQRVHDCSKSLEFALRTEETGDQHFKLSSTRFCRVRLCPVCQWRRSLMWRGRFIKALPKIQAAYPSHRYIFITLTVENCDIRDLRVVVSMMNRGFAKLVKRKDWPGVGWVRSLEVTRNPKTNEAHPHFHALVMVKAGYFDGTRYIKQSRWRELWQSVLKLDYLPVVNVKAVKPKKGSSDDSPIVGVLETLKYSVKEPDLIADPEWLQELTKQLHKTRSVAVGGVFKEFLKEDEPEDLINVDDLPEGEETGEPSLCFRWREDVRRYQMEG